MLNVQVEVADICRGQDDLSEKQRLLGEARLRAAEERDLSSTIQNTHYAAASLGQSPYVSVPGIGVIVLRKCGWGC